MVLADLMQAANTLLNTTMLEPWSDDALAGVRALHVASLLYAVKKLVPLALEARKLRTRSFTPGEIALGVALEVTPLLLAATYFVLQLSITFTIGAGMLAHPTPAVMLINAIYALAFVGIARVAHRALTALRFRPIW